MGAGGCCRSVSAAASCNACAVWPTGPSASTTTTSGSAFTSERALRPAVLPSGSRGGDFGVRGLKGASELASGPDSELGEHVAQVPLDGASTKEQAGSDVRVREPV